MISVRELSKRYGKIRALNNVSFEFSRGVAGLIGPNGAGKTTLIRILVGLAKRDSGEAYILGADAWRDRSILRRVGVLHEKPRPPGWTTGRKFLEHICKIKEISDINRHIRKVSEMLDLSYLDRPISGCSAGMVQRISIAACLIGDPDLVIMDEPTANLDPLGRIRLLNAIIELKKEGLSFFISSHILPELERICDYIIFLNEGKLLAEGPIDHLRSSGSFVLSFSEGESPELVEMLKGKFHVEMRNRTVIVKSKDVNELMKEIAKYLMKGGSIPKDIELRPPTLEEIFLLFEGENNEQIS